MPINIAVTKREIKNLKSGIDMAVTSYEKASSLKQVKYYHVVVITNLPFYKRPEHSEDDTVQFMVLKDYEAFEKLQKDITQMFPELKLPPLPRKFHLFTDTSDIEERQVAFDCLLKVLSKDRAMSVSIPMLQFLGFDLLADKKYFKARREYLQKLEANKEREASQSPTTEVDRLFGNEGDTNDDLFGTVPAKSSSSSAYVGGSIFEEGSTKPKVALLDTDDLFVTTDTGQPAQTGDLDVEDNSELLNVSESLDDVLQISNKKKPAVTKAVPGQTSSTGTGLFDIDDSANTVSSMDTDDIMKYIEQNQTENEDLDLF